MAADEYHAKWSPSGAAGWSTCRGKIAMEEGREDQPSSYADEGTAAHTVATWCFEQTTDAAAFAGRYVPIRPGVTVEVDDEMVEYVQAYVDAIRQYAGEKPDSPFDFEHELNIEQDVPIDHITGEDGATGRADAWILTADGEELQVHDLKYGRGEPVSAEGNLQLLMYASGALRVAELVGAEPKRVRMVIHQVRTSGPDERVIPIHELQEGISYLRYAAEQSRDAYDCRATWIGTPGEADYLNPTEKGCRWCKAKATCSVLRDVVVQTVFQASPATPDEFEDLTADTPAIVPQQSAPSAWLAASMEKVGLIEDWCKAVRAETERRLLAGDGVPGYKLVQGRKPARKWQDAEQAEQMMKTMRLKADEMYTKKVITPTVAEKVLAPTPRRWKKLEALIVQGEPPLSVAPLSDKRPAVEVKPVAQEFVDLTTAESNVDDLI